MNPLRTVGGRLALALLVVVGGALAIVYLIVVPSYQSSLVNTRLKDLRHGLQAIAARPRDAPGELFPSDGWIQDEAQAFVAEGTRVVLFSAAAPARARRGLERRHVAGRRARPDHAARGLRARDRQRRGRARRVDLRRGGGLGSGSRDPRRDRGPQRPGVGRRDPPSGHPRRDSRDGLRDRRSAMPLRRSSLAGSDGSSWRPSASPAGASTSRSPTPHRTSSGS